MFINNRFFSIINNTIINLTFIGCLIIIIASCNSQKKAPEFNSKDISNIITNMSAIMVHDVTNPPLASRFFAYACLAGYEVIAENDSSYKSMYGILNGYPVIQKPAAVKYSDYHVSALLAMMETAKKMQPSGSLFEEYETKFFDSLKDEGVSAITLDSSKSYAIAISKQILAYAKQDGYYKISDFPRYTPLKTDSTWFPTPPGFFAAVEPYFKTIRPFTLDSCNQFMIQRPTPFSTSATSGFYSLANALYKEGVAANVQHQKIAAFWDCNPFAMGDNGHLLVGLKKISPGAHWMGITGIACTKANKSFDESMQIFTTVAVGLMDAFICCWDEKYRSNRVRPETAIRKYIDVNWQPLLQTPPFPEYPSGHSDVSAASATILTRFFGNHFSYKDSVEVDYGLPPRSYQSFNQAAQEAAISRFYGGIHFKDAVDNGFLQGQQAGNWVLYKMKL